MNSAKRALQIVIAALIMGVIFPSLLYAVERKLPCRIPADDVHLFAKVLQIVAPVAHACGSGGSGGSGPPPPPPPPNVPPTAAALSRHWAPEGEEVFLWTAGSDSDGGITKYEWDFDGNGTYDYSADVNPPQANVDTLVRHTYSGVQTYTARLKVTDIAGATATETTTVDIHTGCPATGPGSGVDCTDVAWDGEKWPVNLAQNGIPYVIDLNNLPTGVTEAQFATAVTNALNSWDSRSAGLHYIPDAAHIVDSVSGRCRGCGQQTEDFTHTIFWSSSLMPQDALTSPDRLRIDQVAGGTLASNRCYKLPGEFNDAPNFDPAFPLNPYVKIKDCDLALNRNLSWSTSIPVPATSYDLESTLVHELGHWLTLGDLYQPRTAQLVMYGTQAVGPAGLNRTLGAGDVFGLHYIYGP